MNSKSKSVLVIGFNTRPLTYSLKNAGYDVYTVDFFGDLDLFPNVKDSIIITKRLGSSYNLIKDNYGKFLVRFTIEMLRKYPSIDYLMIGSGLDDYFEERKEILDFIEKFNHKIISVNNNLDAIKNARNLEYIYECLEEKGYQYPKTTSFEVYEKEPHMFQFPIILKKRMSAGGLNIYKISNEEELTYFLKIQKIHGFKTPDWFVQEYIEGMPVSCTVISNGNDCEIISINRQIIGFNFVNAPKDFIYCGNIVPSNLLKNDNDLISEISLFLAKKFKLKGINGFDFVIKNHIPYLMEINPRIPGSLGASERVLCLNLLDLHIKSFHENLWNFVKYIVTSNISDGFATKLIMYASKDLEKDTIEKINSNKHIYDKTDPSKGISKDEPVCTILYHDSDFASSYFGALKIADEIKKIME